MIPRETVDKIFDAADVYDVIRDYINLKKAGANFKGNCPFHDEKTPSFMVSPAKGIYKCFGCGAAGNAVKFVMEHEKVSFPEALKILAKKYHIEVIEEELSEEKIQEKQERDSLFIVTEFAKNFFKKTLQSTEEGKNIGLSYFTERGFRDDIIKKFELGWSPKKRDALTESALKSGYKLKFLENTGLTIVKKESNYNFDRFSERVIFPIHTLSGKVIAFGGRTLKKDSQTAKYLNSPESEIYHKSKILYGIYFAKNSIVKHDKCYMVEGYTDVISMYQSGIENVVASSGTALTTDQIKLVRRFTTNLTIIFDGDPAGIKASLRGIDLVLAEEMNVRIVTLPEGEDPDSFARSKSTQELETFINENEKDFIEFKAKLLAEDAHNDPVKRANLVKDIVRSVAVIPDKILRAEYIRSTAKLLDTKEEILYEEVRRVLRKNYDDNRKRFNQHTYKKTIQTPQIPAEITGVFSEINEKEIISYLLNFGNEIISYDENNIANLTVAQYIINEIKNEHLEFNNLIYKEIFEDYEEFFSSDNESIIDYFLKHQDEKISSIVAELTGPSKELSKKLWSKQGGTTDLPGMRLYETVPEAIDKFKLKIVQIKIKEIDQKIIKIYEQESEEQEEKLEKLRQEKLKLNDFKIKLTNFTDKSALL
ncbi:MAG: DNA primase [Bacteroidales bacterium]|nr:DNA primase [Bacteroidales bacterium]